jgi:hypothetical protein
MEKHGIVFFLRGFTVRAFPVASRVRMARFSFFLLIPEDLAGGAA